MTSKFANMMSSSNFFDVAMCLLSSLDTGPSFMSMSLLVLELWQFSFIRDWPEIWKSEVPPSEFCPISLSWGNLGIPSLARISVMKCYCMLQNARLTAFTVSELLKKDQQGVKLLPFPTQIRVSTQCYCSNSSWWYVQDGFEPILTITLELRANRQIKCGFPYRNNFCLIYLKCIGFVLKTY